MTGSLTVTVGGWADGQTIPGKFAFGVPADDGTSTHGDNVNPAISWSTGPEGTRSYAVICVDPDVPSVFDDANQPGRTISSDLARRDFYHWVLVDVPTGLSHIEEGADSRGVTPGGKDPGACAHGLNGANDYGKVSAGDTDPAGAHGGYDGPCPPRNDARLHHYVFTVYALDVERLGLSGAFGGKDALAAMDGHILAQGSYSGSYTLNQALLQASET